MTTETVSNANPDSPFEAMMPAYEKWGEPVSTALAAIAIERVRVGAGLRVLDIGAGTGNLAVPASATGAAVVAVDNARAMVARLNERLAPFPQSRSVLRSLYDLDFEPRSFDAVFSIFCAAFMPDAPDIFARMVGLTKPNGAICIVNWTTEFGAPMFEILARALHALPLPPGAQGSPGLSRLLEADELKAALLGAGCADAAVETVAVDCRLPPPASFLEEFETFFQVIPAFRELTPDQKARLRPLVEAQYESVPRRAGDYIVPVSANIAIGRTPAR